MARGWRVATWAWVLIPTLGWWPATPSRSACVGLWVLASILVILVGPTQPIRRPVRWPLAWLALSFSISLIQLATGPSWSLIWLYQSTIILLATWFVAERADWAELRRAVLVVGSVQTLVMLGQLADLALPWPSETEAGGTFHHRAALGLWWAVCSLWSQGRWSLYWAILSCLSGSWTGASVAVFRVIAKRLQRAGWVPMLWPLAFVGGLLLTSSVWWPKLAIRLEVWSTLVWLKNGWLTGWGFRPFPTGFIETLSTGRQLPYLEYHNAWIDWLARTGAVGLLGLVGLWRWIFGRLTGRSHWTAALVIWAGLWQSVEANPSLLLLLVVWLIGLSEERHAAITL